ncbi:MAG TPA: methyl-accepting chemotaxis protein, partial [Myxococcota bacterium]|nr:methyl-accepting chemotaxis protein [Myxococcota bacterium]
LQDRVDVAPLARAARGEDPGWSAGTLPLLLDAISRRSTGIDNDSTWWLTTELLPGEEITGRSVGLWLEVSDSYYELYINGVLLARHGRLEPMSMRDPVPPAYTLPAGMLVPGRPNNIAIALHNPVFNTRVSAITLMGQQELVDRLFYARDMPRVWNIGLSFMLMTIGLYVLVWYLRRPVDPEHLYLSLGILGYALLFSCSWLDYMPWSDKDIPTVAVIGVWMCQAFTVFLQRRYRIHEHWVWPAIYFIGVVILGVSCVAFLGRDQQVFLLSFLAPLASLNYAYWIYFVVRAYRAGHEDALWILAGLLTFATCMLGDVVVLVYSRIAIEQLSGVGVVAFVISTVMTLTARFMRLHDDGQSIAQQLQKRQDVQEYVVSQIASTASEIELVSQHILASASQQQEGATEQSTAVEETRRTMEILLASGRTITQAAEDVLQNARMTQQHNLSVTDRVRESSKHSRRITEILDIIRDVANKTELLALNAALEGSRAGEAGRGFALVATEMQHLAESVMAAVANIKDLTSDIRGASGATEASTQQATQLATETTESVHKIGRIIQGQQAGT